MKKTNFTPTPEARSPILEAWQMFRQNYAAMAGLIILSLIVLGAIFGVLGVSPPIFIGFLIGMAQIQSLDLFKRALSLDGIEYVELCRVPRDRRQCYASF